MSGRPSPWTIPGPRSGSSATWGTSRGFSGASGSTSRRPALSGRSWRDEMLYARISAERTGVEVSVWGHTVALIGGTFEMAIAREAVFMLLRGSEHKTVYRFLERKRADIKVYQMGF